MTQQETKVLLGWFWRIRATQIQWLLHGEIIELHVIDGGNFSFQAKALTIKDDQVVIRLQITQARRLQGKEFPLGGHLLKAGDQAEVTLRLAEAETGIPDCYHLIKVELINR